MLFLPTAHFFFDLILDTLHFKFGHSADIGSHNSNVAVAVLAFLFLFLFNYVQGCLLPLMSACAVFALETELFWCQQRLLGEVFFDLLYLGSLSILIMMTVGKCIYRIRKLIVWGWCLLVAALSWIVTDASLFLIDGVCSCTLNTGIKILNGIPVALNNWLWVDSEHSFLAIYSRNSAVVLHKSIRVGSLGCWLDLTVSEFFPWFDSSCRNSLTKLLLVQFFLIILPICIEVIEE